MATTPLKDTVSDKSGEHNTRQGASEISEENIHKENTFTTRRFEKDSDTAGTFVEEQTGHETKADVELDMSRKATETNAETKLTMVGPSQSGKTVLLSALFHNQATSHDLAMSLCNDADDQPPLSLLFHKIDEDYGTWWKDIQDINFKVQRAQDHTASGTDTRYAFNAKMTWQDEAEPGGARALGQAKFKLWDAPGGLFTETYDIDEATHADRDEYRDLFYKSEGNVICLSSDPEEFHGEQMAQLVGELHNAYLYKEANPAAGLKRIAVCFTKIEKRLLDNGSQAHADLINAPPDILPIEAYEHAITVLDGLRTHFDVKIQVFPVSTYGFVGGTGAANFYPHPERPGLLTRSISDGELCESDNTRRSSWRDHFPSKINDATSGSLWQPFNLMPPFFFAATGRVTGPKSFPLADVYQRLCELREERRRH